MAADGHHPPVLHLDGGDVEVGEDLAAHLLHARGDLLPHLSRAELGIEELLDQRGLGALLRDVARLAGLFQEVRDRLADGEALDALCAPLGADPVAGHAPDLFGVGLEESEIQLAAEAVDEELLQVLHLANGKQHGAQVAEADAHGAAPGPD